MSCDFFALATDGVRSLKPYQPGKPVSELQRELGLEDIVKLASNESPLGPSPSARAAAMGCMDELARYPDGNGFALKTALADRLDVAAEMITIGNGSNDILDLVVRAFVGPRHDVVFSEHAFAVYPLVTQAVGARPVAVPARDFGHDLAAIARAMTGHARVAFIANPNNPTGTWVSAAALEDFIERVPDQTLVVVDEAYSEYVGHADYPNCVPWISRFPNLIVTRTFSKAFGLAGLRVGYGVSHPDVADLLNRVRQPFNVNSVALAAAQAALDDEAHLARSIDVNRAGMVQLTGAFAAMGLSYIPSAGNFVAVDVGRPAAPVFEALLREGVIVRPVANYGLPSHLRVTVGLESENARFIAALAKVLA